VTSLAWDRIGFESARTWIELDQYLALQVVAGGARLAFGPGENKLR
jgi:hypothetical protein